MTAIDALGAARLLVLNVDGRSTQRLVTDTLGPLLDPVDDRHRDLLDTLTAFLASGLQHLGVRARHARVGARGPA